MIWRVILSVEVEQWYSALSAEGLAEADVAIERLQKFGNTLRMPHSKPLAQGLFELRFNCEHKARRITYVFDTQRQIITLTVFSKQKNSEQREVLRARKMQKLMRVAREKEANNDD